MRREEEEKKPASRSKKRNQNKTIFFSFCVRENIEREDERKYRATVEIE